MTDLRLDWLTIPTAAVGPANPLPPLYGDASLAKKADLTAAPDYMQHNAAYGRIATISPYLMQDGYGRERTDITHRVAVIENDHLRATFLLAFGGRLWSLIDKATGTELLYSNPILQPANLALRSAGLAGGVEWNIGTIGHSPMTCEPMHAAKVIGDDGEPVLRLYEFERLRRVVYQLDVHLPTDSRALFVHVRIVNPNDEDVPMYWWSNIAVPQSADTRVLAPAEKSWNHSHDNVLRHDAVSDPAGVDMSYPARFVDAADVYFDIEPGGHPWIAAVDGTGVGLFQTSTRQLVGRKLFRWGTGAGGHRWQQWLSGPVGSSTGGYAEIQAGLARTQFEHLRMRPRTSWAWTEAYGRIDIPAGQAHGPWAAARAAAENAVRSAVSASALSRMHNSAAEVADAEPAMLLHAGTGWGVFESVLRSESGEPPVSTAATPFDSNGVGAEQRPWLNLLDSGQFPSPRPDYLLGSAPVHSVVIHALRAAEGWAPLALLGTVRATSGDWGAAVERWQESIRRRDNSYARRNLAVAAARNGDVEAAADHYRVAIAISRATGGNPHPALIMEALPVLTEAGVADSALEIIDALGASRRQHGRVRLLEAQAALAIGDVDRCGAIITEPTFEVPDLQEGEDSLDDLWDRYQAARVAAGTQAAAEPLPEHLDFRMAPS